MSFHGTLAFPRGVFRGRSFLGGTDRLPVVAPHCVVLVVPPTVVGALGIIVCDGTDLLPIEERLHR